MTTSPDLDGVPKAGEVLLGKYRIEQLLGFGGMGAVVAATHLGLDQRVAIKFLLAKAAQNPQSVKRFEREARAAAKIRSQHVARVSDISRLENGTPFMVMEFLEGKDLAELCKQGPLPIATAVDYLLESAEALAEAHQAGIVHRDLKPANLFLAEGPDGSRHIKVLDFGISKITAPPGESEHLTKTSALIGSPLYMAPEQMLSPKTVDHRSDIWALGTILYQMLSGVPPFLADTLPEVCGLVLQQAPAKITSHNAQISPELEAVIERCLEKKPDDRYRDLAALAEALAPFGSKEANRSLGVIRRIIGTANTDSSGEVSPTSAPTLAMTEVIAERTERPIPTTENRTPAPPAADQVAMSPPPLAAPSADEQTPAPAPENTTHWLPPPGASTAEPVMQTRDEIDLPLQRRSKLPWVAALALLGGLLVFIVGKWAPSTSPAASPSTQRGPTHATTVDVRDPATSVSARSDATARPSSAPAASSSAAPRGHTSLRPPVAPVPRGLNKNTSPALPKALPPPQAASAPSRPPAPPQPDR